MPAHGKNPAFKQAPVIILDMPVVVHIISDQINAFGECINEMSLNKFTCGCQSPEGYPCSSWPSGATNQLSTAAMERCFWKTEQ